jgi:WD40 repeat protein
MSDVFVSYARSDRPFVAELAAALSARGRQVWVDLENIPPTAEWLAEIFKAVESADVVLCVLSPAFLESQVCAIELNHAVEQGKRLIPLVRREVETAAVPEALRVLNWLFWRETDDFEAACARVVAAIELDLAWLKGHTQLLVRANDWRRSEQDRSRLLSGKALVEAESWLAGHDRQEPVPTEAQREFIAAGRRLATRRRRAALLIVAIAVVSGTALTVWGLVERKQTARRAEVALARDLIVKAGAQPGSAPRLRAQLAIEAVRRLDALGEPTQDAVKALREARSYLLRPLQVLSQETPVSGIRFSGDGAYLASLDPDRTVRLWTTADWKQVGAFTAPRPIQSFAVTPDGRVLGAGVAGFDESEALILDLTRGAQVAALTHAGETLPPGARFTQPLHSVLSVALLRNGEQAVTAGVSTVRGWSIAEAAEIARSEGIGVGIGPILPGADDSHVGVKTLDGHWHVIDLSSGEQIGASSEVVLAVGPKGEHLLLLMANGREARLVARGADREAILHHEGIGSAGFSADGEWVATGAKDGSVRLWRVSDGEEIARIAHDGPVLAVEFSPDSARLAIAGSSGRIQIRSVEDPSEPRILNDPGSIRRLAYSPDGRYLAIGTENSPTVSIWDPLSGRLLARMEQTHAARRLAFSPDGVYLASLDLSSTHIWRVPSGELYREVEHRSAGATGSRALPWTLGFSADGRYLAIGGTFPFTAIVDFDRRTQSMIRETGSVTALRFVAAGHLLLAASETKIYLLDLDRRHTVHVFSHLAPIATIAVSTDGNRLAVAEREGSLRVWNLRTKVAGFDARLPFAAQRIEFSADSRHLAAMGDGTPVFLYAVRDDGIELEARYDSGAKAMALSPAGGYLASAGDDKIIRVRSIETGSELESLVPGDVETTVLEFSPDGRQLMSAGLDGKVHRWLWRHGDLVADACERLSAPSMSREQWRRFLGETPFRSTCPIP